MLTPAPLYMALASSVLYNKNINIKRFLTKKIHLALRRKGLHFPSDDNTFDVRQPTGDDNDFLSCLATSLITGNRYDKTTISQMTMLAQILLFKFLTRAPIDTTNTRTDQPQLTYRPPCGLRRTFGGVAVNHTTTTHAIHQQRIC